MARVTMKTVFILSLLAFALVAHAKIQTGGLTKDLVQKDDPTDTPTDNTNSPSAGQEVDGLIDNMMRTGNAAPANMQALGDTGSKIALANENTVHKEGSDDDTQDEISKEAATKKQYESTEKADQEEKHKIAGEARQKKIDLNRQEMYTEERQKNFKDNLALMTEQSKKQGREETRKQTEQSKKKTDAVSREVAALKRKQKRDEAINQAKIDAAEATSKDKAAFMIQQTQEEIRKLQLQSKRRRDEQSRKHDIKMKRRTQMFEAEQQKFRIDMEKKDEEQSKTLKRTMEDSEKANQQAKEQASKYEHANARGRVCGACTPSRATFGTNNAWQACPVGMLINGMLREAASGGKVDDFSRITQLECCRPCREDGSTPMSIGITACYEVSWKAGSDKCSTAGNKRTCLCPANTYIAGLYRESPAGSTTAWVNDIALARCCPIDASRGSITPCTTSDPTILKTATQAAGAALTNTQYFTQNTFLQGITYEGTANVPLAKISSTTDCPFYAYVV